jgi:hypothetical protein
MLSVINFSVIVLSVIMLNGIMLSVIVLSVMAPFLNGKLSYKFFDNHSQCPEPWLPVLHLKNVAQIKS